MAKTTNVDCACDAVAEPSLAILENVAAALTPLLEPLADSPGSDARLRPARTILVKAGRGHSQTPRIVFNRALDLRRPAFFWPPLSCEVSPVE